MRILTTGLCFVALSTGAFAQQRPAYLIAEYEVIDAASMKKFGEASNPIVKAHGGQFVARRTNVTPVIGEAPKSGTVIMFENAEGEGLLSIGGVQGHPSTTRCRGEVP